LGLFIYSPERASNVTEVLTKLGLKFNQTDVWGGFGLQYREFDVMEASSSDDHQVADYKKFRKFDVVPT
jgi:hypothetical protein